MEMPRIAASGKAAGVFVTDPALAQDYFSCGARYIAVGSDTALLRNAALKLGASLRDRRSA